MSESWLLLSNARCLVQKMVEAADLRKGLCEMLVKLVIQPTSLDEDPLRLCRRCKCHNSGPWAIHTVRNSIFVYVNMLVPRFTPINFSKATVLICPIGGTD